MIEKKHYNLGQCLKNWLSKHRSNNDNPLTPESLIEILNEYKNKISAIIYVHNQNTRNVYGRLVQTGILTIDVTKHLISKRKGNDKELIRKLKFIHPPAVLEIRNLSINRHFFPQSVWSYQ